VIVEYKSLIIKRGETRTVRVGYKETTNSFTRWGGLSAGRKTESSVERHEGFFNVGLGLVKFV